VAVDKTDEIKHGSIYFVVPSSPVSPPFLSFILSYLTLLERRHPI